MHSPQILFETLSTRSWSQSYFFSKFNLRPSRHGHGLNLTSFKIYFETHSTWSWSKLYFLKIYFETLATWLWSQPYSFQNLIWGSLDTVMVSTLLISNFILKPSRKGHDLNRTSFKIKFEILSTLLRSWPHWKITEKWANKIIS